MPAPPPIPAGIGTTVGPSATGAPPSIPKSFVAPTGGSAPPPIPASIGKMVSNVAPAATAAAPSLARSFGAGIVKGAENLGRTALDLIEPNNPMDKYYAPGAAVNKAVTGAIESGVSDVANLPGVKQALAWANNTKPQGYLGQAAQGAGEVMPFAAGLLVAPEAQEATTLGKLRSLAGLAAMGAGSGVGQKAGENLGERLGGQEGAEVGGLAGSLLGGIAPAVTGYGLAKVAQGLSDAVPMTQAAKARFVNQNLQHFEPDIEAARERVSNAPAPILVGNEPVTRGPAGEILPGSQPTSVQLAGSQGLAKLAEALKMTPEGAHLSEAEAQQAAARANAVRNIGPLQGGSPASVAAFLRRQFQADDASAAAQEAAATAGRNSAIAAQPGATGSTTEFQAGKAMQDALNEADAKRKAEVGKLYSALDEKNPIVNMAPLAQTVRDIAGDVLAKKGEWGPGEEKIMARAHDLGASPSTTWGQVNEFRADLNQAINNSRDPLGNATSLTRRLGILKGGVDNALAEAASHAIARDEGLSSVAENASQGVDNAYANTETPVAGGNEGASNAPNGYGANGPVGPNRPAAGGTAEGLAGNGETAGAGQGGLGEGQRGPAVAPGNLPVSGTADRGPGSTQGVGTEIRASTPAPETAEEWGQRLLGTNAPVPGNEFNAEDAGQYQKALAAHQKRKQLFANPVIGPLLKKSNGELATAPESVTRQLVAPGPNGAKMARAIKDTADADPNILQHYQTAIGLDLRRAAINPDGTINPARFNAWRASHAPLLNEMPDVAARMQSIQDAQDAVDQAVANRAAVVQSYQTKAIQNFLNGEDPSVAMSRLLSAPPADARAFIGRLKNDPQALAGAQQALADHLASTLLSPTAGANAGEESLRVAGLRSLLRDPGKRQVVREVLGPNALTRLGRVLHDYDAYNTAAMSKLGAAGSRTTPLAMTAGELAEPKTVLGRVIASWSNPVALAASALPAGPAGEIGAQAVGAMFRGWRGKHLTAATELLSRALTDPKVFMEVTRPLPKGAAETKLLSQIRNSIANSYINAN